MSFMVILLCKEWSNLHSSPPLSLLQLHIFLLEVSHMSLRMLQLMNHACMQYIQLSLSTYLKIIHLMSCIFHFVDSFVGFFPPFLVLRPFFSWQAMCSSDWEIREQRAREKSKQLKEMGGVKCCVQENNCWKRVLAGFFSPSTLELKVEKLRIHFHRNRHRSCY